MRKLVAIALLISAGAFAGEHLLGTLDALDAGSVTNVTTPNVFNIPSNSKLSIQPPDAGIWVGVDVSTCSPTSASGCILLGPSMLLPTSTGAAITVTRTDGGSYTGGVVTIRCPNGTLTCSANVFSRSGTE